MGFFIHIELFGVIHGSVEPAFLIINIVPFRDYFKLGALPDVPRGVKIIHLLINIINHCLFAVLFPIMSVRSLSASSCV
jgi:hypothetical protein